MTRANLRRSRKPSKPLAGGAPRSSSIPSKRASGGSVTASRKSATLKRPKKNSRRTTTTVPLEHRLNEAIRLKNRGDFTGALEVLSAVVEDFPGCAAAYGYIGGIHHFDLGDAKKAAPYWSMAVQLSPRSELCSLGLFHSLWNLELHDAAKAEMRRFQSVGHSIDYDEITAELREKGMLT
jgi:hypothetical protein